MIKPMLVLTLINLILILYISKDRIKKLYYKIKIKFLYGIYYKIRKPKKRIPKENEFECPICGKIELKEKKYICSNCGKIVCEACIVTTCDVETGKQVFECEDCF